LKGEYDKQIMLLDIELEQQKNAVADLLHDNVISQQDASNAIITLTNTRNAKLYDLAKEQNRQLEALGIEYLSIQGKDIESKLAQQKSAYDKDLQMARGNEEMKLALTKNYEAQKAKYILEEKMRVAEKAGSLEVEAMRNNYSITGNATKDELSKREADYNANMAALKLAYEKDSYEWRNNAEIKKQIDYNYLQNKQMLELQYQEASKNDWQKWADDIKGIDQQIFEWSKQAASDFSTGFTDAFYEFAEGTKSAKLAFQEFAASFLKQIAKMIMQQLILNAIQSAAGSYFGGGSYGSVSTGMTTNSFAGGFSGRASGGPMAAGQTYLTGENGPELISLKRGGYATPASRTKSGANINFAPTINVSAGAGGSEQSRKQLAKDITMSMRSMMKEVMVEEQQIGGISNPISVGRKY
jgi:hypothetical protein